VIEEQFGFNRHTARSFVADTLKQWLVDTSLSLLLIGAMVVLMRNLGGGAWFCLWIFTTVFCLALNIAWPILIAPLFNTFKRLEEGKVQATPNLILATITASPTLAKTGSVPYYGVASPYRAVVQHIQAARGREGESDA
jgi:STE24 endopeptidase